MPVRTRFAPSPTGYLHIGGVRTAIFNWLFARRHGGQFILRIDDTDRRRHQQQALAAILAELRWLGLQWDEGPEVGGPHGPYFQSQRMEKYRQAAQRLVQAGQAYPCFCTPEQIEREREAARQAGSHFLGYSGRCRRLEPAQRQRLLAATKPYALRFAVPPERTLQIDDLVLGTVTKQTAELGDFVIVRANGSPLYNLASVVDDMDMGITHVIRAQEHLSNTWPQLLLFEALAGRAPQFAHLPYVAAPGSREKLSKRKLQQYQTDESRQVFRQLGWPDDRIPNPAMLSFYRELGCLPDAVLNALARIGWSLDDRREKISRQELIQSFSLERVNPAPASFDPDKLFWLQGEYMRELPLEQKVAGVLPHLGRAGLIADPPSPAERHKVRQVLEAMGDRLKVFSDIVRYGAFFFTGQLQYDEAAVRKNLRKDYVPALLQEVASELAKTEPFDPEQLEQVVRQKAAHRGISAARLIHPLRVAISGQAIGPGLFESMAILGRQVCLQRIAQTLELLTGQRPPAL